MDLPTVDPEIQVPERVGGPFERDLAARLLELMDARVELEEQRDRASAVAAEAAGRLVESEAEIVAIKRALGKTAKGRRGSSPTHAATSEGGSPRAQIRKQLVALMADRKPRTPAEVIVALDLTHPRSKTAAYNLLRDLHKVGEFQRRTVGKRKNGMPEYAYRLKG